MSDQPSRSRDSLPPVIHNTSASYGIWFHPLRPKIIAFFGFICLAIGYVGFVTKGAGLPAIFMDMKWLNPDYKPLPYNRVQFTVTAFIVFTDLLFHLVCIAGAIGTLKMRHWGRKTLLWYAILGSVFTLIKAAWQISMFDFMIDFQRSTTTQPLIDRATMENRQFFALIVMTLIQLVWSALLVVLLTNRYIRGRFDEAEGGKTRASEWVSQAGT